MPYITRTGVVAENKGLVGRIVDYVNGVINGVVTFFMTMVSPEAHDNYLKQRIKKQDPPPRSSGPRITGLGNMNSVNSKALNPGCGGGG